MKNIWDDLKVVSIFASCHGVMVIVRVGSPLWLKVTSLILAMNEERVPSQSSL